MTRTRTAATFRPPVMEARRWLDGVTFPPERPLINVSQAAPVDPPPQGLRQAMADASVSRDDVHLYGPVLGLPDLREALAVQISGHYQGTVTAENVGITSGCNQAFAAAIASLCDEGDEVVIPTPWYFNHKMWLDMSGVTAVPLSTDAEMLPDPNTAAKLITARTRAIALVSPNNPAGVEYPRVLLTAFRDLAKAHGIALILDETYRDFDSRDAPPHDLFKNADWDDTLIHLYSFSKAYRLTGHRVGAIVTAPSRMTEVEKFLDTVAICPGQLGQIGALWGMQNLSGWLAEERLEILARRAAISDGFPVLAEKGWKLRGLGAYFAYLEHPFDLPSDQLARKLVGDAGILCLPGTMFHPHGTAQAARELRFAFANLDTTGIKTLFDRLAALPHR